MVAPLVIAPAHSWGRPNRSSSQRRTTSSVCAAAGLMAHMAAFWSIADASQSPASAAGVVPPWTKPKNRGPELATMPGSARRNHSLTASAGGQPTSGNGSSRSAAIVSASAARLTGRVFSPSR
jgi:hypothetical protein